MSSQLLPAPGGDTAKWHGAQTVDAAREISTRLDSVRRTYSIETIATLTAAEIVEVQAALGHGDVYGVWKTPSTWVPITTHTSTLTVDLRKRTTSWITINGPTESKEALLDVATLSISRFLLLIRIGPASLRRDSSPLSATNVARIAYYLAPHLFGAAITKLISSGEANYTGKSLPDSILSSLIQDDFAGITGPVRRQLLIECRRMTMLCNRGLWFDAPLLRDDSLIRATKGRRRHNAAESTPQPYLPLPDDFVGSMGEKAFWIIDVLGPNLFEIGENLQLIFSEPLKESWKSRSTVRSARSDAARKYLADFVWLDRNNRPFEKPPFSIRLSSKVPFGKRKSAFDWPPSCYSDVLIIYSLVQAAHLFVCFLALASRVSEMASLERNCFEYEADGRHYANGRTYKMVIREGGETRDWLLPQLALDAIEQQAALADLFEELGELAPSKERQSKTEAKGLWTSISFPGLRDGKRRLRNFNTALKTFTERIGLPCKPDEQELSTQRFRKTIARLGGLAITEAPAVLMSVFGHKGIAETLYYILTDSALRADIEVVTREIRVMKAKTVIEDIVAAEEATSTKSVKCGGYGGLAAQRLHDAIGMQRERLHRNGKDWGISSSLEFAELLTLQGTCWEVVRKGVICTKTPSQVGPCNRRVGRPEPSHCSSKCDYRLEQSFLHDDVDGAISDCIEAYEAAIHNEESLTVALWAAQVRSHLTRFEDLREKWSSHPTVQRILAAVDFGGTK